MHINVIFERIHLIHIYAKFEEFTVTGVRREEQTGPDGAMIGGAAGGVVVVLIIVGAIVVFVVTR